MDNIFQDLHYAVRTLLKNPGFTAVAVLTLALGIGANAAIFSVVDAVILHPLPVADSDRLVMIWGTFLTQGTGTVSMPDLEDWREQSDVFEGIAAWEHDSFNLAGKESPERIAGASVSANFFDVLGVRPLRGRSFLTREDEADRHRVAGLSYALWQRQFGGDPQIIGTSISVDGESFTVVGVMPPKLHFPRRTDLWVPLVPGPEEINRRGYHKYRVVARVKGGVSIGQAQEQMSAIAVTHFLIPDPRPEKSKFLSDARFDKVIPLGCFIARIQQDVDVDRVTHEFLRGCCPSSRAA